MNSPTAILPRPTRSVPAEIPDKSSLAGVVIEGFRIVTASDLPFARELAAYVRKTHSRGGEHYIHDNDTGRMVRWAIIDPCA